MKIIYLSPAGFSAVSTEQAVPVIIEDSLAHDDATAIQQLLPKNIALVCDANTYEALGKRLHKSLGHQVPVITLRENKVSSHEETVNLVRRQTADSQALVAVGSGVISDVCKYASFLDGKPYITYATALSMNGYVSRNASITIGGHKKTLQAQLPKAVFIDLSVIAAAPSRLNRSGLGDSICRSTAQTDWLMSHLLLGTAYTPLPFELLKPYEKELYENAKKIAQGDRHVLRLLAYTLLSSGMGMVFAGGSYPASQGEHLVAHTMEMKHGEQTATHGEQIAVTTLTMARLQQALLQKNPVLRTPANFEEEIHRYFGTASDSVEKEYRQKMAAFAPRMGWENIREQLLPVMQPAEALLHVLEDAGCPTRPEDIGWDAEDYRQAVAHACYIRNRFTFLDVAKMSGEI